MDSDQASNPGNVLAQDVSQRGCAHSHTYPATRHPALTSGEAGRKGLIPRDKTQQPIPADHSEPIIEAMFSLAADGRINAWSSGAEKITGYSAEDMLGQDARPLYTRRDWREGRSDEELQKATHEGRYESEGWGMRRDGSRFWAQTLTTPQFDENGQLVGFDKILRGKPSRALPTPAPQPTADQHRRIFEHVEDYALFLMDREGKFATWNRGIQRMLGYTEAEFLGASGALLFTEEERIQGVPEEELHRAETGEQVQIERRQLRKDGESFWGTCIVTALRNAKGEVTGFSKIIRDNTERRRIEQTLQNAQVALEKRVMERTLELSQAVNLLEHQLIERERLENALLTASEAERERLGQDLHDGVCQQLTGTAMLTKMLSQSLERRNAPESQQARQIVDLIRTAIDQARDLAKGLHPVSLHSSRGLVAAFEELAKRTCSSVPCRLIRPEKIDLSPGAALHIYRIAQETVQNALKHADAQEIRISVHLLEEHLELTVSDDGKGFHPKNEPGGGMGLLNLQYRARAIRARLTMDSQPGQGTVMRCLIPLSKANRNSADGGPGGDSPAPPTATPNATPPALFP